MPRTAPDVQGLMPLLGTDPNVQASHRRATPPLEYSNAPLTLINVLVGRERTVRDRQLDIFETSIAQ
jgi:hypothetical protein